MTTRVTVHNEGPGMIEVIPYYTAGGQERLPQTVKAGHTAEVYVHDTMNVRIKEWGNEAKD